MSKEQFFHAATVPLFQKLERLTHTSHVSRGQAFEDWLTAMVCALAAETKEDEYLSMVERHKVGKKGQRGIDLISEMFADLVMAISREDHDVLGDLFQGAISYGENSLYVTPESVSSMMARLSLGEADVDADSSPTICDPCCGTGIMLIEAGKLRPNAELLGQDIDSRCAKITAINLGLRGRYGWVMCGNTLTGEARFAYRIGSFFHESPNGLRRGVIRDVPPEMTPLFLAQGTRHQAQDLLASQSASDEAAAPFGSRIIEVPQWLARLEPRLATSESTDEETPAAPQEPVPTETEAVVRKQKKLF